MDTHVGFILADAHPGLWDAGKLWVTERKILFVSILCFCVCLGHSNCIFLSFVVKFFSLTGSLMVASEGKRCGSSPQTRLAD